MGDVRSKGTNIHGILTTLGRVHGEASRARVLAAVAGEAGEALRHGAVVSSGWYPVAWHDATLKAIEDVFPSRRFAVRELAYEAVKHDFQTLFKVVSLVASPSFALTNATKIMARYYDGGRVSLLEARLGYVHFRFEDYRGFTSRIWDDVHGGLQCVVDMMGVARQPFDVRGATGANAEIVVHYKEA